MAHAIGRRRRRGIAVIMSLFLASATLPRSATAAARFGWHVGAAAFVGPPSCCTRQQLASRSFGSQRLPYAIPLGPTLRTQLFQTMIRPAGFAFQTRLYSTTSNLRTDAEACEPGSHDGDGTATKHNDDWKVPKSLYIPEDQLDMSFVRSGGAGGQNVNKVNTQVQIKLAVVSADWIPEEVRQRLSQQQSNRINKDGELILQVSEHRTQMANRRAATDKLRHMILQAWPRPKQRHMRTGLSKQTKEQRKHDKRKRGEIKAQRRPVRLD